MNCLSEKQFVRNSKLIFKTNTRVYFNRHLMWSFYVNLNSLKSKKKYIHENDLLTWRTHTAASTL